jgi:hypothetical protein
MASSSTRHKGFFATLFGGGADQEEDEADIKVASTKADQVRASVKKPAASSALPGVEIADVPTEGASQPKPEKPGTIIAALPPQDVPLPLKAPRPEVDVGPAAPDDAAAEADEPQVAINIPLPTRRPDYSPPAEVRDVAGLRHDGGKAGVYAANADQLAALLAGRTGQQDKTRTAEWVDPRPVPTLAAFAGPLPSARPAVETNTASIALLPERRPTYEPSEPDVAPAVFMTEDKSGKGDRLGSAASPRLAVLERPAGVSAAAALASGVRTAGKHARRVSASASPQPKSFEMPIHDEIVRWAVQHRSFNPAIASSMAPSLAYNIVRSMPRMVYTTGFRAGGHAQDASRFSGNAVTFLPVARFSAD